MKQSNRRTSLTAKAVGIFSFSFLLPIALLAIFGYLTIDCYSLVFLAFPIGSGILIRRHFWSPLREISSGIHAVQNGDFSYRIPVSAPDELGEIAFILNQVTESMADLAMAKTLQDQLFPETSLELEEYLIFGKGRSMADVGGDYFDYQPIENRYIFGLLGDVAGHGVSAAMVMTMAKCFFNIRTRENFDLNNLLQEFHYYLYKTLRRAKMMTLMLFRVDLQTHKLLINNAGQTYPCYFNSRTKQIRILELPSLPLGAMKKALYESVELDMEPGDILFVCSDGLPEARTLDGEEVGYKRLGEWLNEACNLPPKEIVEHFLKRLEECSSSLRQEDDLTLICLKKKP